jgi:hypothetical protein
MKQVALNNFDLQKIKLSGKRGLSVFWYAKGNNNDLLSVDSDAVVHQDLIDVLSEFRVVFADSFEALDGWNHARDFIKANDNALKNAVIGYDEEVEKWIVNSVDFKGSGENEGIVLKGSRQLALSKVKVESPLIKFSSECVFENLQELVDKLKEEVWQYVFKAKREGDLFANLPENERGLDTDSEDDLPTTQAEVKTPKRQPKAPQRPGLNVA